MLLTRPYRIVVCYPVFSLKFGCKRLNWQTVICNHVRRHTGRPVLVDVNR